MILFLQDQGADLARFIRTVTAKHRLTIPDPPADEIVDNRVWWAFVQIEELYEHKILEVIHDLREDYPYPPAGFGKIGKQGSYETTGTDELTIRVVGGGDAEKYII